MLISSKKSYKTYSYLTITCTCTNNLHYSKNFPISLESNAEFSVQELKILVTDLPFCKVDSNTARALSFTEFVFAAAACAFMTNVCEAAVCW